MVKKQLAHPYLVSDKILEMIVQRGSCMLNVHVLNVLLVAEYTVLMYLSYQRIQKESEHRVELCADIL